MFAVRKLHWDVEVSSSAFKIEPQTNWRTGAGCETGRPEMIVSAEIDDQIPWLTGNGFVIVVVEKLCRPARPTRQRLQMPGKNYPKTGVKIRAAQTLQRRNSQAQIAKTSVTDNKEGLDYLRRLRRGPRMDESPKYDFAQTQIDGFRQGSHSDII